jgi:CHAT domain-containing protein
VIWLAQSEAINIGVPGQSRSRGYAQGRTPAHEHSQRAQPETSISCTGGHADFVESSPQQSGLILNDGKLTAADLLEVGKAPHMIFLNACESGRMRGPTSSDARATHFVGQVGLAEGFLLSGIANFIGTYWPVNDLAALRFAHTFYQPTNRCSSVRERDRQLDHKSLTG